MTDIRNLNEKCGRHPNQLRKPETVEEAPVSISEYLAEMTGKVTGIKPLSAYAIREARRGAYV